MGNLNPKPIHPDLRNWFKNKNISKHKQEQICQQLEFLSLLLDNSTFEILGKRIKIQVEDLPNYEEDEKFWDAIERFPAN